MKNKAFTLIELLVVILIIGILAAIAFPQYKKAVEKSHLTEALSIIQSLDRAIQIYILENGYPTSTVHFLGDRRSKPLSLDIATTRRLKTITYANIAQTEYFHYNAYIANGYFDIIADRTTVDGSGHHYRLFMRKNSTGSRVRSCQTINNSSTGTLICTLLKKEGWS